MCFFFCEAFVVFCCDFSVPSTPWSSLSLPCVFLVPLAESLNGPLKAKPLKHTIAMYSIRPDREPQTDKGQTRTAPRHLSSLALGNPFS